MSTRSSLLVLGIGNELLGDDGLGVVAAGRLARADPPGVEIIDGGTLGLMLMPYLADRHAVLVLDAISAQGRRPGELVVLRDEQVRKGHGMRASAHDIGLVDALSATELAGCAPRHLALVGMVPESIEDRYGLSPLVAAGLDAMVSLAKTVMRQWGAKIDA